MARYHPSSSVLSLPWLMFPLLALLFQLLQAQQSYVNNKQLQCEQNYTNTLGFVCNDNTTTTNAACSSYITFRSTPVYNSPVTIGYLLDADPGEIASLNNISDVATIPTDTLLIVPVNCSCSSVSGPDGRRQKFYQHNASYFLKYTGETYFSVSNNTYQGLSTCQSMIAQNPYNYRHLLANMKITVPLRCACPSPNQTANGIKYLLSYLVLSGNTINDIADIFSTAGADNDSILYANELAPQSTIYPYTPLLIPLKSQPTKIGLSASPALPPPSPPTLTTVPVSSDDDSSSKWVYVGVGTGAALLLIVSLSGFLVWFFRRRSQKNNPPRPNKYTDYHQPIQLDPQNKAISSSMSISSSGVRYAIEYLTAYKFEELQQATGFFAEENRIRGSVYRGSFKGDDAAVKIMKGDVSGEINILKKINHSNIVRLSGLCVHQGNTYLVYEYAEKGSLSDLLHDANQLKTGETISNSLVLGWNQRVQIAYDVADALNYLHNYTNPPYIHKNLTSSNVLLDGNTRAKIANFGLARTLPENHQEGATGGLQMTRHVVGTHGFMAPEYVENGLITPKLDVFSFGVVVLELLSGREAVQHKDVETGEEDRLLSAAIVEILGGETVREKLREFMDPCLRNEYPLDLAYSMAQLARNCVSNDLNSRPNMAGVFTTISKIHSSSMDWDPSDELEYSRSLSYGR